MLIVVGLLLLIPFAAVLFLLLVYELLSYVLAIRTGRDQGQTTRSGSARRARRSPFTR